VIRKINGEWWEFWELEKVYQWLSPNECFDLEPKKIEDLPNYFMKFLKTNTKRRWLELTTHQHGARRTQNGGLHNFEGNWWRKEYND
jgi:hypothetical protein